MDEFFDVLYEEPLDRWYEIGNVIAIADAKLEESMSEKSDYLLASEVANAGLVILSKSQEADIQDINNTIQPIEKGQDILIIIGEGLAEEKISTFWEDSAGTTM